MIFPVPVGMAAMWITYLVGLTCEVVMTSVGVVKPGPESDEQKNGRPRAMAGR